jgi:pyruvate formate lyase activating enzyme
LITDSEIKGNIVRFERFAIHDGPGIRTVIFFKGCPLRCKWCSTPESQIISPEMVYYAAKCTHCGKCVSACPKAAIKLVEEKIITDKTLCDNCGKCIDVCPNDARQMMGEELTVAKVIEEVDKDAVFYWNSGGGVTLSGGEPTLQPKFALGILKACKERGIHTVMETCGYADWNVLDSLLKYLDWVYLDIKHILPSQHEKLTGKRNDLMLENCSKILKNYPRITLVARIPVIPGYNDSEENILETARFVSRMQGITRLELLPYHRFGLHMYEALLKDYALADVITPTAERMHELEELAKTCGIQAQVGG